MGETRLVIVLRQGHPLTDGRTVTAEQYAAAEHVTVSRRGNLNDAVDDVLTELGPIRRVVAAAPTEAAAPEFARGSDLLVCVPEATTRSAVTALGLAVHPLPLELSSAPVYLSWDQRQDTDQAHIWLRDLARTTLARCAAPS